MLYSYNQAHCFSGWRLHCDEFTVWRLHCDARLSSHFGDEFIVMSSLCDEFSVFLGDNFTVTSSPCDDFTVLVAKFVTISLWRVLRVTTSPCDEFTGSPVTWSKTECRPDTVLELDDIGCVHKVTQIPFYWMNWLLVRLLVMKNCASDIYLELSGCGVHHQLLFNLRTLHLSGANLISKCWSWSWRMSVSVLCICKGWCQMFCWHQWHNTSVTVHWGRSSLCSQTD